MLDSQPTYPVAGAFVVQLHRNAMPDRGLWIGRIEHVVSGTSHEFTTCSSLLAWLTSQASNADVGVDDFKETPGRPKVP